MTTLAVQRSALPRHRQDERLSQEDWQVLDQLLRHGFLAATCSTAQLDGLVAEGLIVRLPAAVLITDWGEICWRQELRRRRRAWLSGRPGRG